MTEFRGAPGQGSVGQGDPAVWRDVRVAAVGVLGFAGLSGLSALVSLGAGLVSPAGRLGGLIGGVIGGLLACGLGLAGMRLLKYQVRGAHLATRILGALAVLGAFALFRNLRSGMFIERWPSLLIVLAGLVITLGLIYLQHRAVQALTPAGPATPAPGQPTPPPSMAGIPPTAPPMAESSATESSATAAGAAAPAADAGPGPVTGTGPYGPPAGPGGAGYPPGPAPSDPRRTVPLLLIGGGGVGAALILLAVVLVGALIWPGWLIRDPVPGEDSAKSTMTVFQEGIESRNIVTLQSVICGDADPYVTAFAQRVLKEYNLTSVEGTPTIDGATAEAKLTLRNDGQATTWTVELAPRNARTWCVAGIYL